MSGCWRLQGPSDQSNSKKILGAPLFMSLVAYYVNERSQQLFSIPPLQPIPHIDSCTSPKHWPNSWKIKKKIPQNTQFVADQSLRLYDFDCLARLRSPRYATLFNCLTESTDALGYTLWDCNCNFSAREITDVPGQTTSTTEQSAFSRNSVLRVSDLSTINYFCWMPTYCLAAEVEPDSTFLLDDWFFSFSLKSMRRLHSSKWSAVVARNITSGALTFYRNSCETR